MSYDVWLEIDAGGEEPARIGEAFNYTSNVGRMFREAGHSIQTFEGEMAGVVACLCQDMLRALDAEPDKFRAMNPANGWGSYEGARDFLERIRQQCDRHPAAIVRVCS